MGLLIINPQEINNLPTRFWRGKGWNWRECLLFPQSSHTLWKVIGAVFHLYGRILDKRGKKARESTNNGPEPFIYCIYKDNITLQLLIAKAPNCRGSTNCTDILFWKLKAESSEHQCSNELTFISNSKTMLCIKLLRSSLQTQIYMYRVVIFGLW